MAPPVTDFGKLLEGIPQGAWVAIAQNENRVIAHAAELQDAIRMAQELGEPNPIVVRVPQFQAAVAF
jgi:uncharacterized lipoprotein YddW (UPF0748 family)